MNPDTGKIHRYKDDDEIPKGLIEIQEAWMTEKQKRTMQVSKYDSISKLGRLFTGTRKERRQQAKEYRKKLKKERKAHPGAEGGEDEPH